MVGPALCHVLQIFAVYGAQVFFKDIECLARDPVSQGVPIYCGKEDAAGGSEANRPVIAQIVPGLADKFGPFGPLRIFRALDQLNFGFKLSSFGAAGLKFLKARNQVLK